MIEGTEVTLGEKKYIVPPLNIKAIKRLKAQLDKMGSIDPRTMDMDPVIDVLEAALKRNYPDLTRDELEEVVDLNNVKPLVAAVMGISGFKFNRAGEVEVKGGESGESPSVQLTGTK